LGVERIAVVGFDAVKRSHNDPVPQFQCAHAHGSEKRLLICMGNLLADLAGSAGDENPWVVIHNSILGPNSAIVGEHGTITGLAGTTMFERVIHFLHRERLGSANA
jgi:hypothetical protein